MGKRSLDDSTVNAMMKCVTSSPPVNVQSGVLLGLSAVVNDDGIGSSGDYADPCNPLNPN
jgi:hypothetical protein